MQLKLKPSTQKAIEKRAWSRKYKTRGENNYSSFELHFIAHVMNRLIEPCEYTAGAPINTYQMQRFYNKTHYIDFSYQKGEFKVYKKNKAWKKAEGF